MTEAWYIDGYNVVYDLSAVRSKKHSAPSNKVVMNDLFSACASFAAQGSRKVLVVLDGIGDNNEYSAFRTRALDIVYSAKATADSVIEKSLYEARGQATLFVVTKDRALSQIAHGVGAHVISPSDFFLRINEVVKDKDELLFKHQVKAHGFNRPFEEKFKKFDLPNE